MNVVSRRPRGRLVLGALVPLVLAALAGACREPAETSEPTVARPGQADEPQVDPLDCHCGS